MKRRKGEKYSFILNLMTLMRKSSTNKRKPQSFQRLNPQNIEAVNATVEILGSEITGSIFSGKDSNVLLNRNKFDRLSDYFVCAYVGGVVDLEGNSVDRI